MNGYDLAKELRSRPQHHQLVLVALTGYGKEEDRRNSLAAGFSRHLVKPVDPATLTDLLAEC
jgi:CheY-like chemotaxis protein